MSWDVFILTCIALVVVASYLDKLGDARLLEAEARKLEAETRSASHDNEEPTP